MPNPTPLTKTKVMDHRPLLCNTARLRAYHQRRARYLRAQRHGLAVHFPLLISKS